MLLQGNVCELLNIIHSGNFKYVGIDLFGDKANEDEKVLQLFKKQSFSNPIKNLF